MTQALMYLFAACAVIGGVDRIFSNRLQLGEAFDRGLALLGPAASSMAGMLIMAPWLANLLSGVISPVYRLVGLDPSLFGGILAVDMGGYEMSVALADDPTLGLFSGILVGSTLGCTISYTIPVGMEFLKGYNNDSFVRGILYGLMVIPIALFVGGLLLGLAPMTALVSCIPLLLLSGFIAAGMLRWRDRTIWLFRLFAAGLRILSGIGLTLGAFQSLSGITVIADLMPLEDALKVVCNICILLLGALPFGEILTRLLRRPMTSLSGMLGLRPEVIPKLLLTLLTVTPGLAALPELDERGRKTLAGFAVCGASSLTAHLAYAATAAPETVGPLLAAKLLGALLAVIAILIFEKEPANA